MNRFFLPVLIALPMMSSQAAPTTSAATPPGAVTPPGASAPAPAHTHEGAPAASGKPADPLNDSLDFLWEQSDEAFHKGDYPTAIKIHRAIVTLDPTDTESYGVGAWLLWSLGQKEDAHAFVAQGLKANPKNPEMWDVAGQQYEIDRSFPLAKAAFIQAVALSNGKADELLRRRLAHAAQHAGDLALSLRTWQELARDFPASAVNKNNLARVQKLGAPGKTKA